MYLFVVCLPFIWFMFHRSRSSCFSCQHPTWLVRLSPEIGWPISTYQIFDENMKPQTLCKNWRKNFGDPVTDRMWRKQWRSTIVIIIVSKVLFLSFVLLLCGYWWCYCCCLLCIVLFLFSFLPFFSFLVFCLIFISARDVPKVCVRVHYLSHLSLLRVSKVTPFLHKISTSTITDSSYCKIVFINAQCVSNSCFYRHLLYAFMFLEEMHVRS